jgi:hypothetical protein
VEVEQCWKSRVPKISAPGADAVNVNTARVVQPSGNETFDRARTLYGEGRIDEALDWFEVTASGGAEEPAVRASACAFAAGVLLSLSRPWEVSSWTEMMRADGGDADLADLLDAAAHLRLGEIDTARDLLDRIGDPSDPWFPVSPAAARMMRAHVAFLDGATERATGEVLEAFARAPLSPDVWDAFARLCADTRFDPAEVVEGVPDDSLLEVLAFLRHSEPAGVDRIAEYIWLRNPGDARVLALVPKFAARLDSVRAMEWSARLRAAGMGRLCPLLERAKDARVGAAERARAAALAHASFGDTGAREALEAAVPHLDEHELVPVLNEVWDIARMLLDSVVVAGATTPTRCLSIAAALYDGGATDEAYAVLTHGLAMEAAEDLTTEKVVELMPVGALEGLAAEAERRGEDDVAGILEAVAVVAGSEG